MYKVNRDLEEFLCFEGGERLGLSLIIISEEKMLCYYVNKYMLVLV